MLIDDPRRDWSNQAKRLNLTSYRARVRATRGGLPRFPPPCGGASPFLVDHTMPETNEETARCHGRTRPNSASVAIVMAETNVRELSDLQDPLAADRPRSPRRRTRRTTASAWCARAEHLSDREARSGNVQGEQSRRQQLKEPHRVDATADRPKPQERGRGQQRAQARRVVNRLRHTLMSARHLLQQLPPETR